jgi:hypothetical protein
MQQCLSDRTAVRQNVPSQFCDAAVPPATSAASYPMCCQRWSYHAVLSNTVAWRSRHTGRRPNWPWISWRSDLHCRFQDVKSMRLHAAPVARFRCVGLTWINALGRKVRSDYSAPLSGGMGTAHFRTLPCREGARADVAPPPGGVTGRRARYCHRKPHQARAGKPL